MKIQNKPTFTEELIHWNRGIENVIGLDEVGRGAFAGPIVAAGVIFKPNFRHDFIDEVNDSKLLKPKIREKLSELIKQNSIWEIAEVELDFINREGIGKANFEVFSRILKKLIPKLSNHFILVDGFDLKIPNQKGIIKGDSISLSIASASIIAKVHRDKLMKKLAISYPNYLFEQNVGYGTKAHRDAIKKYGLCEIHRTSFNIV